MNTSSTSVAISDHDKNLEKQANEHWLLADEGFQSIEQFVLHLIHRKAYESAAEIAAGKSVLDWGCNTGYGIEILLTRAQRAAGLDLSPRAVSAARSRLNGQGVEIEQYNAEKCSFPSESFDVVTSFQVIEHISDYATYFGEIQRVLKPNGFALFSTPNAAIRLDPGMKPWNEFHVREFQPAELQTFLKEWFSEVQIRGLFGCRDLYAIERTRTEKCKIQAKKRFHWWKARARLINTVKRLLPGVAVEYLRARLRHLDQSHIAKNSIPQTLSTPDLPAFDTRSLFYKDDDRENAIDLFAICRK